MTKEHETLAMTWHIASAPGSAEKKIIRGLRENGFTVVQPCLTVWRSVPKGQRERAKTPMFPGYVFLGQGPETDLAKIHDPRTPVRLVRHGWPQARLFALVCDLAFRELAGEFDQTGSAEKVSLKPTTGPLNRKLGNGLDCLSQLLKLDERGRLDLLTSGELIGLDPIDDRVDAAA